MLERYATEVEQYHTKNELVKRDQIATEVCRVTVLECSQLRPLIPGDATLGVCFSLKTQ